MNMVREAFVLPGAVFVRTTIGSKFVTPETPIEIMPKAGRSLVSAERCCDAERQSLFDVEMSKRNVQ
ncbi:hypothetical protein V1283_006518 [Bradyrhizobium sp. AZCC 2262]|uniref:hypothetical protein n=1 Tax=Bradyrhizobium sp. AZCC 2262 TaxID=3117022 RepID=UPI002FF35711